jgi:hypothetical protein
MTQIGRGIGKGAVEVKEDGFDHWQMRHIGTTLGTP